MTRRMVAVLLACCFVAAAVGTGAQRGAAGAGVPILVLKFPVVRDFGSVQGKVLYVRRDLPPLMPLRFVDDRVEAVSGFFPAGKCVSVLSAGMRLGSAVVGEDGVSISMPPPPVEGALEVVESDRPVPASGTCIKVKLTGGVLRLPPSGGANGLWAPPPGTIRMVRAHLKGYFWSSSDWFRLLGWDGVAWKLIAERRYSSGSSYDLWVDVPPGMTQLKVEAYFPWQWSWADVPEVEVEVPFVEDVIVFAGDPGVVQGPVTRVPTDGVPYLQAPLPGADLWSNAWSPPAKTVRLLRVWLEGQSERDWDYGYLYGWDGVCWHLIAKRSGVYSEWVNVPPGITRLMVRLVTDGNVLESPTYVHVRAAEVEWGSSLTVKVKSTDGALRLPGANGLWAPPPGTIRMLRAHLKGYFWSSSDWFRLLGWDGVAWKLIAERRYSSGSSYDLWVDVPPGMTQLKVEAYFPWRWSWADVPEVEVEEEVSPP